MQTLFILRLSILMVWYATVLRSESVLDETVLEKDLYSILGLPSGASVQEIKKRFRQLAQQHHPDKAKSNSRHDSTATFQELSEAYDILSNKESRAEYDAHQVRNEQLRKAQERFSAKSGINDMGDRSGFEADYQDVNMFEAPQFPNVLNDYIDEAYAEASLAGPLLYQGQVVFPYDEILTTPSGQVFALIDSTCALVVYRGDVYAFAETVHRVGGQLVDDAARVGAEELYRSPGFPYLHGRCVGVLDYSGVFHICVRDQYGDGGASLWSTSPALDEVVSDLSGEYVMQLSADGELTIHRTSQAGRGGWERSYECVWSTTSCHPAVAVVRDVGRTLGTLLRRTFALDRGLLSNIGRAVQLKLSRLLTALHKAWVGTVELVRACIME